LLDRCGSKYLTGQAGSYFSGIEAGGGLQYTARPAVVLPFLGWTLAELADLGV
jgi:hypothetical protein